MNIIFKYLYDVFFSNIYLKCDYKLLMISNNEFCNSALIFNTFIYR